MKRKKGKLNKIGMIAWIISNCTINTNKIYNGEFCMEWNLGKTINGYGKIKYDKRTYTTHRLIYSLHNDEILKNMFVCHKCDNRICCNISHLFIDTHQDNMNDMKCKNRQAKANGEDHSMVKVSINDIIEIRKKYIPK